LLTRLAVFVFVLAFVFVKSSDEQVLVLYKELYFRHIYAKMQPTVDDKFDSFQNYVDLFNLVLGLDSAEPAFELPSTWLWDIVDEFIYQFQTFHLFRNKVADLSAEEIAMLKEHEVRKRNIKCSQQRAAATQHVPVFCRC